MGITWGRFAIGHTSLLVMLGMSACTLKTREPMQFDRFFQCDELTQCHSRAKNACPNGYKVVEEIPSNSKLPNKTPHASGKNILLVNCEAEEIAH